MIQRKQREYRDGTSSSSANGGASSRLNEDLNEIQNIMKKNIDEILNRGEKLDHVSSVSSELKKKSKDFKWGAQKVTWQARWQQYGPIAIGFIIIAVVLYLKFFYF
jgi:vesicle transport protein SEC22